MKQYSRLLPLVAFSMAFQSTLASSPELPKVEILGKEYYYHEIKKGESIYGIARKYDWDIEELVRLNPNATSDMKKGTRLYYPTGKVTMVTKVESAIEPVDTVYEPIRHVVKKGETVYSISRQYNIPLDVIYAQYPDSKYGIKAGQSLEFQQSPAAVENKYLYYVVKPGDTLYALAKRYRTSVEDILKANPGISEVNFRIGDTVRINVDSNSDRYRTELVEEERLASIDSYKVKKKDSWSSISKKTGVDVETLKEANEEVALPEKNDILNIPVIETVKVEKQVNDIDPRELSEDGIRELYDSIHKIDSGLEQLREVRVAMLLDDPVSKKDVDFSRGVLMALDGLKDSPFKIRLKVIDGRKSTTSVTDELDSFEPNLLIATADKNFPAFLADYGESNHLEIVNAFDVRNELYEDNPSIVQILPPSSLFNEQIAESLTEDYGNRELLMVGIEDENDGIAELLKNNFPETKTKKMSINSLAEYEISDDESYLIYAFPQKKDDVNELLATVSIIREKHPVADLTIVGRPNWVTMTESFNNRFDAAEIVVPARCWFDADSEEGRNFVDKFTELFGQAPIKSFPNFAVSGFDIANFFVNSTAQNGGDYNQPANRQPQGIQTDFRLQRVSNWGGFLNPSVYVLKFRPSGSIDKIEIR
ncbi:MAG: LysM peptidoglycan-binding domain-containing protein [Muribaculaceae bacterium]